MLVAPVETEERLGGGAIILPQTAREDIAQWQVTILAIGLPEICEDKHCDRKHEVGLLPDDATACVVHAVHDQIAVGDWCVVRHRSLLPSDDPLGKTFYVHQNDVLMVLSVSD